MSNNMNKYDWKNDLWEPLKKKEENLYENEKIKGIRVAAYCRTSKTGGYENYHESLEHQVIEFTELIISKENWDFVGIYFDKEISGTTLEDRPALKRLLKHCEERKIDLILTKSVSRLYRNTSKLVETLENLKKLNVGVYFQSEKLYSLDDNSDFPIQVIAAIEQERATSTSQKIKTYHENMAKLGKFRLQKMYGYDIVEVNGEKQLQINEKEAEVIRWIYQEFVNGKACNVINQELTHSNIISPGGLNHWTSSSVKKIVRRMEYIGNKTIKISKNDVFNYEFYDVNKNVKEYLIENCIPPIITKEIFNQAQQRIAENLSKRNYQMAQTNHHIYSKRITCGRCGQSYRSRTKLAVKCPHTFLEYNLCNSDSLRYATLLKMIVVAIDIRFNLSNPLVLKSLLRMLENVNESNNYEFERVHYYNDIYLLKQKLKYSTEEAIDEQLDQLRQKYQAWEKDVSKIEADEIYRDMVITWLKDIENVKQFKKELTIEMTRAWVKDIIIYSHDSYIIYWSDGKKTSIGEKKKDKIIQSYEKFLEEKEKAVSIKNKGGNQMNLNILEQTVKQINNTTYQKTSKQKPIKNTVAQSSNSLITYNNENNVEVLAIPSGINVYDLKNFEIDEFKLPKKENKKLRVAAYCRVSTLMQNQLKSLKLQISYYTFNILKNKDYELVDIYVDEGISGKEFESREDLKRLIEDSKKGKIDLVLRKSISRLSRSTTLTLQVLGELKEHNTEVFFEKENIRTSDENANLMITMYSSIAQNESQILSDSVKWGIKKLAMQGIINRGTTCFGYKKLPNHEMVIDEKEAEAVRFIFDEYLRVQSIGKLQKSLYEHGILSPKGNEGWTGRSLIRLLNNEKYIGDYLAFEHTTGDYLSGSELNNGSHEKILITDHHEPIISREKWKEVHDMMESRKITLTNFDNLKGRSEFYRKYVCDKCGANMLAAPAITTVGQYMKWKCYNRSPKKYMGFKCDSIILREEYMEYHFMKFVFTISRDETFKKKFEEMLGSLQLNDLDYQNFKDYLNRLEMLNKKLYKEVDDELIQKSYDVKAIDKITDEIIEIRKQLKVYREREEKNEYFKRKFKKLMKASQKLESMDYAFFYQIEPRIQRGESIKNILKESPYVLHQAFIENNHFYGELFEDIIKKVTLTDKGVLHYETIFGIDHQIDFTQDEYVKGVEKEMHDLKLKEFLLSKECQELKQYMQKEPASNFKMDTIVNYKDAVRFRKKYTLPLLAQGFIEEVEISSDKVLRYRWVDEKNQ